MVQKHNTKHSVCYLQRARVNIVHRTSLVDQDARNGHTATDATGTHHRHWENNKENKENKQYKSRARDQPENIINITSK